MKRLTCKTPLPKMILAQVFSILVVLGGGYSTLEANEPDWNGYWAIEAFNFMIEVDATTNSFEVIPVLPATLPWTPGVGEIRDGKGYINVEYQGVSANLLVQLTDPDTALVQPINCMPEYHMLCALAQSQRAILTRVDYQPSISPVR
ncbi:MAG: hypothetical protein P1V33_11635 [Pseudohongiella nitratireducens]|nr:hypothetical protein [Pseudohongiella nitratireducens]MDF1624107.1 hypothetical protein [Pseudohongiella nitratireducens]